MSDRWEEEGEKARERAPALAELIGVGALPPLDEQHDSECLEHAVPLDGRRLSGPEKGIDTNPTVMNTIKPTYIQSRLDTAKLSAIARPGRCNLTNPRDRRMAGVEQSPAVKTFDALFAELSERARTRPAGSGTVAALDGGVHGLGKKILEEAGEVWLAAEHEGDEELAGEISQLLYWTQVLMISRGLTLDDVYAKL